MFLNVFKSTNEFIFLLRDKRLSYSESIENNYMEDDDMKKNLKKNGANKKLISLGLLLSMATFIAAGTAFYHMIDQPNTVNAEQTEKTQQDIYSDVPLSTEEASVVKEEDTTQEEEKLSVGEESVEQEAQPIVEEVIEQETQPVVEEVVQQEQQPIVEEVAVPEAQSVQVSSAMTLNILGTIINYQNGGTGAGQSIIDGNPSGVASTWGGSSVQSGSDGMNTHFIGHNPGIFNVLFSLSPGNSITITDSTGAEAIYTVRTILTLDDYGIETSTGEDYYNFVVGSGGGERVTFQTCINDTTNLIVVAYA